jgi:hypothetical protein
MNHRSRHLLSGSLLLILSTAAGVASAADSGSGYFRYDKLRMDVKHAYAITDESKPGHTLVFLTSLPLDMKVVADAFDSRSEVDEQMHGKSGGYVRVCVDAEGKECGLYFSHNEPSESFNMSGSGVFTTAKHTPAQNDGRWLLDKPEDFFGKTYEFDLKFSVATTAPSAGTALPADGGAPGRAYTAYLAALTKGDLPALRKMLGESGSWRLPENDENSSKEGLKDMRDGKPVSAKILSAVQRGDHAVLNVEGVDRDEIKRRGRVLMTKTGEDWRYETADLSSVD